MSAQAILRRLRLLPEGSPARALLTDVHRLHTLRGLLPYVADLVRYGYLSADLGERIPSAIDEILTGLLPHIEPLVSAFLVPEEFLGQVPIASDDPLTWFDDPEGPWHSLGR